MADERRPTRARKGLTREAVIEAALDLIDRRGEEAFGIRPLAAELAVDPMTVLHHVGSRERAVRDACDLLLRRLPIAAAGGGWKEDLVATAWAFRTLALRHPRVFPLLLRYSATGPADYAQGERVYSALLSAGLSEALAAQVGLAFYALVIGLAAAEVGGMLKPPTEEEVRELETLDARDLPVSARLACVFRTLSASDVMERGVRTFIDGVAVSVGPDAKWASSPS